MDGQLRLQSAEINRYPASALQGFAKVGQSIHPIFSKAFFVRRHHPLQQALVISTLIEKVNMKSLLRYMALFAITVMFLSWSEPQATTIAPGQQPQLSIDTKGEIRLVFGRSDSIFCATSANKGVSFSNPVFVGHIKGMHLGMSRGPQIASSATYSLITAMDKAGNIHFFQLNRSTGQWKYKGLVNDISASAPEGLMSIAADKEDHFYAVWLDLRRDRKNNICFSALKGSESKWKKNTLIYTSPDAHVCECCKPTIAVKDARVSIMFRNWVQGSRDLYWMSSSNAGQTFTKAEKLGVGTWKLNACPMDGGGITIDRSGKTQTAWRREGTVYYCKPNDSEISLGKGRTVDIAANTSSTNNLIVTMQDGPDVKVVDVNGKKESLVGKGSFLKSMVLDEGTVLCVWEQDKTIQFKRLALPFTKSIAER
jgi:hypothetical protein